MEKNNVLILEEYELVADSLEHLLFGLNVFNPNTTHSGEDNLYETDKNKYCLLLVDQRMPEKEGTEFIERVVQLESHKTNLPIIYILNIEKNEIRL